MIMGISRKGITCCAEKQSAASSWPQVWLPRTLIDTAWKGYHMLRKEAIRSILDSAPLRIKEETSVCHCSDKCSWGSAMRHQSRSM